MLKSLFAAALLVGLVAAPTLAEEWTYTDGTGQTVTLDHVPNRIVMHANTAAGLIPLGIRPIAIYVDTPVAEDKSLQGLDLTGIEIVGEAWGQIDIEKVAALKPDLFLAEWWPLDKAFSGLEGGNGGSNADALHIVGELNKSFERLRPLSPELKAKFEGLPFGEQLANNLEAGLSSHALGFNVALKTAVENDTPIRDIAFAQELNALVRPGDVLLAISTSGNAANCLMAMSVAKAHGAVAVALTWRKPRRKNRIKRNSGRRSSYVPWSRWSRW